MIAIAIGTPNQASAVSAIAADAIAALSSRGGLPQWPIVSYSAASDGSSVTLSRLTVP